MATYSTILLNPATHDLCLDGSGSIARADPPYAVAQDAACEVATFNGEQWYDTANGVPYFQEQLGKFPSYSVMRMRYQQAALNVPGTVAAKAMLHAVGTNRRLTGVVLITDEDGLTATASF